jgi:hypothetical protein
MRLSGLSILALALLLANAVVPARANLVTDPGFESCTAIAQSPPGWSGNAICNADNPHTGSWDAYFSGLGTVTLSQSIATAIGGTYDFSFWQRDNAGAANTFTASFGADEVLDLVSPSEGGYTLEDFAVSATASSTTIEFTSTQNGGFWNLDDVSVTQTASPVPEPASFALVALLGGGLLGIWRRRI